MADWQLPRNITCGYFDSSEFHGAEYSPVRRVVRYEIEYYLADACSTFVNGKAYPIRKDTVKIAVPGQMCNSCLPFTTMYFKFDADGALAEKLQNAPTFFTCYHPDKVQELLKRLALGAENDCSPLSYYRDVFSVLDLILSDAAVGSTAFPQNYRVIDAAKQYIAERCAQPISLQDIADAVHLSPTYFHTLFTAALGCTPHRYLIRQRINLARRLLWDTSVPLCDIAEQCGFATQQYFSRVFRKEVGQSPAAYRKANQIGYLL